MNVVDWISKGNLPDMDRGRLDGRLCSLRVWYVEEKAPQAPRRIGQVPSYSSRDGWWQWSVAIHSKTPGNCSSSIMESFLGQRLGRSKRMIKGVQHPRDGGSSNWRETRQVDDYKIKSTSIKVVQ